MFKLNSIIKVNVVLVFFSLFQSCSYFNTVTITPKQIKEQSTWSDLDQTPTFPECENEEQENHFTCFEGILRQKFLESLSQNAFISLEEINEEIVLEIEIDSNGNFSLAGIQDENRVLNQIETLSSAINTSISELPQALPAVKTNVGIKVNSSFKLPIQIVASPQQ